MTYFLWALVLVLVILGVLVGWIIRLLVMFARNPTTNPPASTATPTPPPPAPATQTTKRASGWWLAIMLVLIGVLIWALNHDRGVPASTTAIAFAPEPTSASVTVSCEDGWKPFDQKILCANGITKAINSRPEEAVVDILTHDGKIHTIGLGHDSDPDWQTQITYQTEHRVWFARINKCESKSRTASVRVVWGN